MFKDLIYIYHSVHTDTHKHAHANKSAKVDTQHDSIRLKHMESHYNVAVGTHDLLFCLQLFAISHHSMKHTMIQTITYRLGRRFIVTANTIGS